MAGGHYDAVVIGVGGMGSAAVYELAARGRRVLGIDRYDIPNAMGSSHGVTRIIRLAYYEHPSYVPLLRRAYERWRDLEARAGERLLHITGSIDAGPADGFVFPGSLASCREHNLPHQVLTGAELNRRFPGYRLPPESMAVLQPEGGFLLPERCIAAHAALAREQGAEVHTHERVLGWEASDAGVSVRTESGSYTADRLVICAGPWAAALVPELRGLAAPERQVLAWLQPERPEWFAPERFPVFNVEVEEGRYYGFPEFGVPGFKFGRWGHRGERVEADAVDRECHPEDEDLLRAFARRYFPDGSGAALDLKVCLFTLSPDEHFIIDRHPREPRVVLAAGFSGHGFKFCSVVGEILADLAETGATRHGIDLFRLGRFAGVAGA
jgi:sarcosine oxidase